MEGGAMEPNIIKSYELKSTLGVGSFGKVKLARHLLAGTHVAIKMLNRARIRELGILEKVRREIKILRILNHPHIIRLYDVIETPSDVFLVMEFVPGGELFDYIVQSGRLPEDEARRFCQQIICGLECCHQNNIIHRDLKPENLILDKDNNIKIADFGLSNIVRDGELLRTSCGSPNYAAPEVISGNLYAGAEVDLWSCGVILYALLCGSLPFDDNSIPNLFKKIKMGEYNSIPSHVSQGARELISGLLVVDPLKRLTIKRIRRHPWFLRNLPHYLQGSQALFSHAHDANNPDALHEDLFQQVKERIEKARHDPHVSVRVDVPPGATDEDMRRLIVAPEKNDASVLYDLLLDQRQSQIMLAEQQDAQGKSKYSGADYRHAFPIERQQELARRAATAGGEAAAAAAVGDGATPGGSGGDGGGGGASRSRSSSRTPKESPRLEPRQRIRMRKRRWYLGIQSKREAGQVMLQIFRVLSILNFEWRVVSPFNIRCRWIKHAAMAWPGAGAGAGTGTLRDHLAGKVPLPGAAAAVAPAAAESPAAAVAVDASADAAHASDTGSGRGGIDSAGVGGDADTGAGSGGGGAAGEGGGGADALASAEVAQAPVETEGDGDSSPPPDIVVKISLQLYKVQDSIYLLDFHSLEGHPFRFMSLCSKIICNLQMGLASSEKILTSADAVARYSQSAPPRT